MKCVMCPRTIFMTRKNIWIDDKLFEKLTGKVKKHDEKDLNNFWNWLEKDYNYSPKEVSENGFYFSVVSRCLVLHGFGEPFLDKKLIQRLEICTANVCRSALGILGDIISSSLHIFLKSQSALQIQWLLPSLMSRLMLTSRLRLCNKFFTIGWRSSRARTFQLCWNL